MVLPHNGLQVHDRIGSAPRAAVTPKPPHNSSLLDAALSYARAGYRVFPLEPDGKRPTIKAWPERATTNDAQIREWWRERPNANIGVATGGELLVIDVDTKNGKQGLRSLELLETLFDVPQGLRVRTPSGGWHIYLRVPAETDLTIGAESIDGFPGLDHRCNGGYVVGAGSVIGTDRYESVDVDQPVPLASLPPADRELIGLCRGGRRRRDKSESCEPLVELDLPNAIARAVDYLKYRAPEAAPGNRNDTAYRVAAQVRDFGISETQCFALMSEHWESASIMDSVDELMGCVANAYSYATGAWGGMSGLSEFDDVSEFLKGQEKTTFGEWIRPFDPTQIPKRAWVLGEFLAKGYLTALVAPPGAGKTTLEITMAVALAAGRSDVVGMPVTGKYRVFLWNQEDEMDELRRRLAAVMRAFNVTFKDLTIDGHPSLLIGSGVDDSLMIARRGPAAIVPSPAAVQLIKMFIDAKIDVAMFDPFVELHPADENSNVEINQVAQVFRKIAVEAHCAVVLAHHTRKPSTSDSTGHIGNMDSGRGAGALIGVTRMGGTLYTIDDKTAGQYGVPAEDRHRYVRFDRGRNNMGLAGGAPQFFKREGVNIGTFEDPEEVGILRPIVLQRRKAPADQRADDLAEAAAAVVGEAEAMPAVDIARALIISDPLYSDASAEALTKALKRLVRSGKMSGFRVEERSVANRSGRVACLVRTADKGADGQPDNASADSPASKKRP